VDVKQITPGIQAAPATLQEYNNQAIAETLNLVYGANWWGIRTVLGDGEQVANNDFLSLDSGASWSYEENWAIGYELWGTGVSRSSLHLWLGRTGNPGTVTVSIQALAGGLPDGVDLVSETLDGDALPVAKAEQEITLSPAFSGSNGTAYAVIIRAPDGDAANLVKLGRFELL